MHLGKINRRPEGKDSPFQMPLQAFSDSREELSMIQIAWVPLRVQDFGGESNYRCRERARNLEPEGPPEDVNGLLQSHSKT